MKKFQTKRKNIKKTHKRAIKNRSVKKRSRKGGLLFNSGLNIGGIDLNRQTGQKQYNWGTGKWDDKVCYGIGPLKGCKIVPAQ